MFTYNTVIDIKKNNNNNKTVSAYLTNNMDFYRDNLIAKNMLQYKANDNYYILAKSFVNY